MSIALVRFCWIVCLKTPRDVVLSIFIGSVVVDGPFSLVDVVLVRLHVS